MRIVDIRELSIPLRGAISNAVVSFDQHTVSLVAVRTDRLVDGQPLWGLAFNSIGRHAQGGILRERMIPRLLSAAPDSLQNAGTELLDPTKVLACALQDEKPGGHGDRAAAAGAIELAIWDLLAKYHQEPAYQTIARAYGRRPETDGVAVYAAGGYYHPDDDLARLRDEVKQYLDQGYHAVKIKVGGVPLADDLARIEAATEVTGSGEFVAVDANGRFDLDGALQYAEAMQPYGLRWFEEPVDPLALRVTNQITQTYNSPLATGENLFSVPDVQNLLDFGGLRPGLDILQMDAGLSYGLTEYATMIELMESAGFSRAAAMPHGGHLINLHIVTGLGLGGCEAYPGVFQPFGGYSPECVVDSGTITPAEHPGFGLEAKTELRPYIDDLVRD